MHVVWVHTYALKLCHPVQGGGQASPSPPPSAAATDEERGETRRARQRKRKDPEVVDERTMRMQKRMVGLPASMPASSCCMQSRTISC